MTLIKLKKIVSRTAWPISIKFGTKHPLVMGIQVCSSEEPFNSHKVNNGYFLLLMNIIIIVCVLSIITVFSGDRPVLQMDPVKTGTGELGL